MTIKNEIKILFHAHTNYSTDCLTSVESFRGACQSRGLIPIITDHNTIKGALEYRKRFGKKSCIIGEEIKTRQGEVIGIYVKKEIPSGLDISETMKQLKRQKAIIVVPHPFDRLRRSRLHMDINRLDRKYKVDFIETFNSRTMHDDDNSAAKRFFEKYKGSKGYMKISGADAHCTLEFSSCYNTVKKFDITKKEEFIKAFRDSLAYEKKSSIAVHAMTKAIKILGLNREKSA